MPSWSFLFLFCLWDHPSRLVRFTEAKIAGEFLDESGHFVFILYFQNLHQLKSLTTHTHTKEQFCKRRDSIRIQKRLLKTFLFGHRRNNPQELASKNIQKDLSPQSLPWSPNQEHVTTPVFADRLWALSNPTNSLLLSSSTLPHLFQLIASCPKTEEKFMGYASQKYSDTTRSR